MHVDCIWIFVISVQGIGVLLGQLGLEYWTCTVSSMCQLLLVWNLTDPLSSLHFVVCIDNEHLLQIGKWWIWKMANFMHISLDFLSHWCLLYSTWKYVLVFYMHEANLHFFSGIFLSSESVSPPASESVSWSATTCLPWDFVVTWNIYTAY